MSKNKKQASNTNLPVIQSLWIGGRLSLLERLCIHSYLENGHPFHLYTYGAVEDVPSGATVLDAEDILPRSRCAYRIEDMDRKAVFADWFRWELLFEKGGIWSDMDCVCLKPIDRKEKVFIALEQCVGGYWMVANGLVQFPAQHPLVKIMRRRCANPYNLLVYDDWTMWRRCLKVIGHTLLTSGRFPQPYGPEMKKLGATNVGGPKALHSVLRHHPPLQFVLPTLLHANFGRPSDLFTCPDYAEEILDQGGYNVVHFSNSALSDITKNRPGEPGSCFARLLERYGID